MHNLLQKRRAHYFVELNILQLQCNYYENNSNNIVYINYKDSKSHLLQQSFQVGIIPIIVF